jgi:stringent starvation protein B
MFLRKRFGHVTACVFARSCATVANRSGEHTMELHLKGDGTGFEIRFKGTWRRIRAMLIAVGLLVPVVIHFGSVLGFW